MKTAHLASASGPRAVAANVDAVAPEADLLDAFVSESQVSVPNAAPRRVLQGADALRNPRLRTTLKWICVVAVSVAATLASLWAYQQRAIQPVPATLTLQTTPPGLQVAIAGKEVGVTPLALSLPAGDYAVVLTAPDGRRRELAVTLSQGGSVMQHVEMGAAAAVSTAATGALRVETDPPGQVVLVDGVRAGTSPVTVSSLAVGRHAVVVRGARGEVRRTVAVERGETVSLVLSPVQAASAVTAGWLTVASPVLLQLRENGKLVGTTESERLMMPAGEHELELSNAALGFRATRRFNVAADQTTTLRIDVPNGMLSINALPWAEVWIAGERIGQTPIANISRPIGTHEVILRHPQLGERKATVTVSTTQSARLGVDMRAP